MHFDQIATNAQEQVRKHLDAHIAQLVELARENAHTGGHKPHESVALIVEDLEHIMLESFSCRCTCAVTEALNKERGEQIRKRLRKTTLHSFKRDLLERIEA